jgi:Lon protease-like protein
MNLRLFPLNLVPFPGQALNLHIFEPRYKQLIQECLAEGESFGIPSYIQNTIEYGVEMLITSVEKTYEDGRMDIKTVGRRVFKVEKFNAIAPGKLYSDGSVHFLENRLDQHAEGQAIFTEFLHKLFSLMQLDQKIGIHPKITSFEIAHKMGLTLQQEFELLKLASESERQNYLIAHIKAALPILEQMKRAKAVIKMNGHFRYFNPLDY